MRAVIVGASALAVMTARLLLGRSHEVVVIERDKERLQALANELDCGLLHGDGSKPAMLREADPAHTDVLFCITGNDQANIIASLVGRSLGFERIVTQIEDPEFEHICTELKLENTIIPVRTISRHLADIFEGRDPMEMSTMLRDEARTHSFVADETQAGPLGDLKLPGRYRVICLYRDGHLVIPDEGSRIEAGDEVVLLTDIETLQRLRERS